MRHVDVCQVRGRHVRVLKRRRRHGFVIVWNARPKGFIVTGRRHWSPFAAVDQLCVHCYRLVVLFFRLPINSCNGKINHKLA